MACKYCNDTGMVIKVNNEIKFEKYFELYSSQFGNQRGREMALLKVGHIYIPCPHCSIAKTKRDQ